MVLRAHEPGGGHGEYHDIARPAAAPNTGHWWTDGFASSRPTNTRVVYVGPTGLLFQMPPGHGHWPFVFVVRTRTNERTRWLVPKTEYAEKTNGPRLAAHRVWVQLDLCVYGTTRTRNGVSLLGCRRNACSSFVLFLINSTFVFRIGTLATYVTAEAIDT
jgi:hypothetical protein